MNDPIRLEMSNLDKIIFLVIASAAGGALGWFMPKLAHWVGKLSFIPFSGAIEWFFSLNTPWMTWVGLVIGMIVGLLFSMYVFSETVKMKVTDEAMELTAKEQKRRMTKAEISAIYLEHKQLVFLGEKGEELLREEKPEVSTEKIREAFLIYDYAWKDTDPYAGAYFLWVEQHPELGELANTLLASREKALREEEAKKAKTIRQELANLGIVVYDEGSRQYIRIADLEASQ